MGGDLLGIPVIDHWWQTETGWPIAADLMGLDPMPTKPGSPTMPVPGYDVRVVDPAGARGVAAGHDGEIVLRLPLPPGCLPTLWGDDQRFVESYLSAYPGYYITGDGGYRDSDGYLYVMGRTDDVINVAGHRLSTGEMEEVLASHPAVAECAVIGVHDPLKGQIPRGFVVLKAGVDTDHDALCAELVAAGPRPDRRRRRAAPGRRRRRHCPRPAPARYCARPCAASLTARTSPCPLPSTTRPSSTRCAHSGRQEPTPPGSWSSRQRCRAREPGPSARSGGPLDGDAKASSSTSTRT